MSKRKKITIAVAACALALACAGGALAWLSATGVLVNQFGIGTVKPTVEEDFSGAVKSNVYVTNEGTAPMYLRAEVDIYWQDEQGNRLWEEPVEGTDYQIVWGNSVQTGGTEIADAKWAQGSDGHWYWSASVAPAAQTGQLIKSVTGLYQESDKRLVVDVITQAVQASPDEAVEQAWGCSFTNGLLVPPATATKGE